MCRQRARQCWNSKGWRPEGLVEAAARDLEGFKSFKRLKPGKRQAWMPQQQRAMCRQRAGCNPGTAKADGQRAWWQLPRGIWRVLRVLRVWSLANGRFERPNNRGYVHETAGCNAGTAEAYGQRAWWKLPRRIWRGLRVLRVLRLANGRLERPNNRGLCAGKGHAYAGTAKADGQRAWWKLPRGIWRVLRVLSVWSLANGRLECPNNRGLCAGKGQAATLEQQKLTARGLGGSCREGFGGF